MDLKSNFPVSTPASSLAILSEDDMRILVVEDDDKIASFLVKGLKQSGYAVDRAADGERAFGLAQSVAYDAAIVDLMLPKLDGLTLIQQLRGKHVRTPRAHPQRACVRG
jgi:two-component system OmpR family response regulator